MLQNNNILQEAINHFTNYAQANLNVNLHKDILKPHQKPIIKNLAYQCFRQYKVYDDDLWFNIDTALKKHANGNFNNNKQIVGEQTFTVCAETLAEFVFNKVNYQQTLLIKNQTLTQ